MTKEISATLPTYQVAAVLREYLRLRKMPASEVDRKAGYDHGGRITRRILNEETATTELETAEKIIDAVGGAIWEVPDYNLDARRPRSIRLRMVKCACGCNTKTLSHYIDIRANGKHRWRKKIGLDDRRNNYGGRNDQVFIHGHKSRLPELRERYRQTTASAWTPERRQRHAERIRELHRQGRYPKTA